MALELIVRARGKDLGGFTVRRSLPYATHRMVGPFIFFDHMGPADFSADEGINVRPHPHVNLATVTFLFEGAIHHRDSLGSSLLIEPGAINWMIAGHGIVHSERTPANVAGKPHRLHGLQCWVALPQEFEEIPCEFAHHPASTLPEFKVGTAEVKLLLGRAFGRISPVKALSDIFYIDVKMPAGSSLRFPCKGPEAKTAREIGAYLVEGHVRANGDDIDSAALAIARTGDDMVIEAVKDSRLMLLGGATLGPRFIEWNFVSSSAERMKEVKHLWQSGPSAANERFKPVPGDDQEFIPLPLEPAAAKGTPM